jgi:hypothetical protein
MNGMPSLHLSLLPAGCDVASRIATERVRTGGSVVVLVALSVSASKRMSEKYDLSLQVAADLQDSQSTGGNRDPCVRDKLPTPK